MEWSKIVIEIVGYAGMALVLASFLMKKVHMIRLINASGAILCLIYGILTKTWPTAALNGALFVINTVFLSIFLAKKKKESKEAKPEDNNDKKEE